MSHEWDSGWLNDNAWHGLGNVRGRLGFPDRQPASMEELRRWAGITWEPVEQPLYTLTRADLTDPDSPEIYEPVAAWKAIVRSDNGHVLMSARDTRGLITNTELCELVEVTMGEIEAGGIEVHGMMSLRNGGQVVVVCTLDERFQVPGDPDTHQMYATFGLGHDGSASLTVFPSAVKTVCMNTWNFAKAGAAEEFGQGIVIRHTKNVKERIEQARLMLSGVRDSKDQYLQLMEELVGVPFENDQLRRFVVEFIPSPPETLISDRVARNIEEARAAVTGILNGRTVAGAGIGGTAYGCLMAATEYLDHVRRSRDPQTKFRRSMLRQEPLKNVALKIINRIAEGSVSQVSSDNDDLGWL